MELIASKYMNIDYMYSCNMHLCNMVGNLFEVHYKLHQPLALLPFWSVISIGMDVGAHVQTLDATFLYLTFTMPDTLQGSCTTTYGSTYYFCSIPY